MLAKASDQLLRVGVGVYLHVLSFYLFGAPKVGKRLVSNDVNEALIPVFNHSWRIILIHSRLPSALMNHSPRKVSSGSSGQVPSSLRYRGLTL